MKVVTFKELLDAMLWHKENYTGDIENLYETPIHVRMSIETAPMRGIFAHPKDDRDRILLGLVEKLV